ncbi:MAG: GDYXXLXY domain-containing protein [Synergistaceae bacterium]|jgi:uncharacterized membrane-anchored protein|nr:GDYXXLXY domain-containing protein [Synergistaceae bacterium]
MTRLHIPEILRSQVLKYAAMAILPLAALMFQPALYFAVLSLGDRVLLETIPVDPRDFLRGDYVILNYKISSLPDELHLGDEFDEAYNADDPVFVTLSLDPDGVASVSGISTKRPLSGIYLEGNLSRSWLGDDYSVDYGLRAYYVPEGTGRDLEEAIRSEEEVVLADVRVLMGRGIIKELLRKQ